MNYLAPAKPRLFAHRGSCGTHPENTLDSFEAGLAAGADILELDVHVTADGEIVVLHDAEVDRTTDGHGPVNDLTLKQLKRLDAGHRFRDTNGNCPYRGKGIRIPTLAEVFERFPDTPINIEVKPIHAEMETSVVECVDRYDARDLVLLAAEHDIVMQRLRSAAPGMLTSHSREELLEFYDLFVQGRLDEWPQRGQALQVPHYFEGIEVVTRPLVEAAHRLGLEVHVWTINDPEEMRELVEMGVDGIMSDFPTVAAEVLGRRRPAP